MVMKGRVTRVGGGVRVVGSLMVLCDGDGGRLEGGGEMDSSGGGGGREVSGGRLGLVNPGGLMWFIVVEVVVVKGEGGCGECRRDGEM